MKQEDADQEEKVLVPGKIYINTVTGPRLLEEMDRIDAVLSHEHLIHNISYLYQEPVNANYKNEITIDTLGSIQRLPHSHLSNLVLNNVEEMSGELSTASASLGKIVVVETSRAQDKRDFQKLREIAKISGIDIICGFDIYLDRKLYYQEEDKNKLLFNRASFLKELHLEFTLGSKGTKPNFIGPILLRNLVSKDELENQIIDAYFEISKSMGVPIMLEASENQDFAPILDQLLDQAASRGISLQKLLLINPVKTSFACSSEKLSREDDVVNILDLLKIAKRGVSLSFDVSYYSRFMDLDMLGSVVAYLCKSGLKERVMLSSGIQYKIDLIRFGGDGYRSVSRLTKKLRESHSLDEETVKLITKKNILNLMNWWVAEKPKVVEVKKWTCPECNQVFNDSLEKFKKMGVEVCSSKCLKAYFSKNKI